MRSVTYAKRTDYKPIDILFRGAVDAKSKTGKVVFVDAVEVLNDRYLGRMYASNYFAIAENTVRINELILVAIEELKNYHLVMRENFYIPEKTVYCMPISTRFLDNEDDFKLLLSALKDNDYKKGSIILSFFGVSFDRLSADAQKRYTRLRRAGYKTAVSQFGEDYNSIDIFAGVAFDYLRCEASYFDASAGKKKLLAMLVRFCNANKINLVMDGVDSPAQYARFKRAGVKTVTGNAVSKLSQWVTNSFLGLPELDKEKKIAYMAKLQKELDANERAENAEFEKLRKLAIDKARTTAVEQIMPSNPRPQLEKSPYRIRLERQKQLASECAIARLKAIKMLADERGDDEEELLYKINEHDNADTGNVAEAEQSEQQPVIHTDVNGNAYVTKGESGVPAPAKPQNTKKKTVTADLNVEARLLDEYRTDGLFDELGSGEGFRGFGVSMHIETDEDDAPPLVGSYNENGQWVDSDGNVFDGYFDENGKWIEYEKLDLSAEGHYNEYGQWVDAEGVVYDGYFDEDGKWIDYTFADQNGETVDNGYFDTKIGKWVAFGYFDGKGAYHRF